MKDEFLIAGQLFLQTHNATIAADEQGFGGLAAGRAIVGEPGCVDLQAQTNPVALSNSFGTHGDGHVIFSLLFRLTRGPASWAGWETGMSYPLIVWTAR